MAAGWVIQNNKDFNRNASLGVAVREFQLTSGPCDYLLFVEGKAAGVIEAKKQGFTLSGVADESEGYMNAVPSHLAKWYDPLIFNYESTGDETYFRDMRDPKPRSRRVFSFHQPETLLEWLQQPKTLRARLMELPPLNAKGLRDCQVDAILGLDNSLAESHPRSLIQMATGAGKTFTACSFSNRLIRYGKAKRMLFLVDRNNLGDQTLKEYQNFTPPNSRHRFTDEYIVKHLHSNGIDPDAIVKCINPKIGETICDPACGTGGFLLAAYDHLKTQTSDKERLKKLREESFTGIDIVDEVVRLCAMNLYLHNIGNGGTPVRQGDALVHDPGDRFNIVLTNPPFGKKSSYKVVGEDGQVTTERENYEREDFKFTTSNKQFNFLQHIMTILETDGRAGVVLPDNVLFEAGKAGEGIRKRLLEPFNFHTLLRLPTGIWYSPGVKANVLFFDKKRAAKKAWTKELWIYDFRTNIHFTLKNNTLKTNGLDDFVKCYKKRTETERFKCFSYDELIQRDKLNLDITWLKDDSLEDIDSLPSPDVIAAEIVENLTAALEQFRNVTEELNEAK